MYKTVNLIENKKKLENKKLKIKGYKLIDGQFYIFKFNKDLIQCGLQNFKN